MHFNYRQGVAVEPQGALPARKESGTPVPFDLPAYTPPADPDAIQAVEQVVAAPVEEVETRQFDAANIIGFYQGRRDEVLQRVEFGASASFNINAGQLPERYR